MTICNLSPIAGNDSASVAYNTACTINVLANDHDPNCDKLTICGTPTVNHGTVCVNSDGSLTYTPDPGFSGNATICYQISDGHGGYDTATCCISVAHPVSDHVVEGTSHDDLIDADYTGDPQGDRIDAGDGKCGSNDDVVKAGAGNDTILSGAGNDTVYGEDGNDLIDGGAGNDSELGGAGNDTFIGGAGNDTFGGGAGTDVIDYSGSSAGVKVDLTAGTLTGGDATGDVISGGIDGIIGSKYADSLVGFDQSSSDPNDTYSNVFYGNGGNDTIIGKGGDDSLYGGADNDYIDGGTGNDLIDGGTGNDTIVAGGGQDTVTGGAGNDTIDGGDGDDSLHGNDGNDSILGGAGQDTLYGDAGNDTLNGGDGDDKLYGGDGDDSLIGGKGQDSLDGGAGNDILTADGGSDLLMGGADSDTFVINAVSDAIHDTVVGGETGNDWDTLDLSHLDPNSFSVSVSNAYESGGNMTYDGTVTFFNPDHSVAGSMNFSQIENIKGCVIPCFTPGTLIATPKGERPVEELQIGDRVITRDNGIQEIRWVGRRDLTRADLVMAPHLRPVLVRKGSLGNGLPERDMLVSPNHRMLIANERTSLYFDEHEVLVAAKHLSGQQGIGAVETLGVSYLHFMFDRHEVVLGNGAWTESFQPGDQVLGDMGDAQRSELFEVFPELAQHEGLDRFSAARRTLRKHEARILLQK